MKRLLVSATAAIAGAVAMTAPDADAATISLEGGVLSYRAMPGERNYLVGSVGSSEVRIVRTSSRFRLLYTPAWPKPESSSLVAGAGCAIVPDGDGEDDPDVVGADDPMVSCAFPSGSPPRLSVELGDRNDYADFDVPSRGSVSGGAGSDFITGSPLLEGGPGDDQLQRTRAGAARGGPGDDELALSEDVSRGALVLDGGPGDDRLNGSPGRDILRGGAGDDRFGDLGDAGADVYRLGPGRDQASSEGADTIFARDREYDDIECAARTTVVLDALDFYNQEFARCMRVRRRGLARSAPRYGVAYLEANAGQYADAKTLEVSYTCPYDGPRPCAGSVVVHDRQGRVARGSFHDEVLGEGIEVFRLKPATLRRLARWARITVVSYDRRGGLHRHSIAGPDVVEINDPRDGCC